jgi:hypothetical protein
LFATKNAVFKFEDRIFPLFKLLQRLTVCASRRVVGINRFVFGVNLFDLNVGFSYRIANDLFAFFDLLADSDFFDYASLF